MRRVPLGLSLSWLLSIAVATPVAAAQQAQQTVGVSATSALPAQAPETSDEGSVVTVKHGRLSANVQNRSLDQVAEEFSQKTGVRVILDSELASASVSIQFQDLSVEEGFRQLFKKHDAFFFYGVDNDKPSALKTVWVYPEGKARAMEPVPPEKWASTEELGRMLSDPDPAVRGSAIQGILERKGGQALADVERALQDPDDRVRMSALDAAIAAGVELPENYLRNLALNDASADVRLLALQSLAGSPDAQSVAEMEVNDPSEAVRAQAQEILRRLSGNRSPQRGQNTPGPQRAPNR